MTVNLTGNVLDHGWLPHLRDTWEYCYATLKEPLTMEHYQSRWDADGPIFKTVPCEARQTVKIVMVSRFGDVGITERLKDEHGYGKRVALDDLCDFRTKP